MLKLPDFLSGSNLLAKTSKELHDASVFYEKKLTDSEKDLHSSQEFSELKQENMGLKKIIENLEEVVLRLKSENKSIRKIALDVAKKVDSYKNELEKIKNYHDHLTNQNK